MRERCGWWHSGERQQKTATEKSREAGAPVLSKVRTDSCRGCVGLGASAIAKPIELPGPPWFGFKGAASHEHLVMSGGKSSRTWRVTRSCSTATPGDPCTTTPPSTVAKLAGGMQGSRGERRFRNRPERRCLDLL